MVESNFQALDINFIGALDDQEEMATPQINEPFADSPYYAYIIFLLLNLQAPPSLTRTKARFLKMKSLRYCIIDNDLFWKDDGGILLNCLLKGEDDKIMQEFHVGDCEGHLYWKTTSDKILRAGFLWPTMFADVKKNVTSYHKCQILEGKRKLLTLPLKPISTKMPFQQWGLDFIGEIHPASSAQHKWILTTTDYFTKWIEAIPSRQATKSVIISFLENNVLSRFGCPQKLITDYAVAFKSKKMVDFCKKYHITLGHSTAYYP